MRVRALCNWTHSAIKFYSLVCHWSIYWLNTAGDFLMTEDGRGDCSVTCFWAHSWHWGGRSNTASPTRGPCVTSGCLGQGSTCSLVDQASFLILWPQGRIQDLRMSEQAGLQKEMSTERCGSLEIITGTMEYSLKVRKTCFSVLFCFVLQSFHIIKPCLKIKCLQHACSILTWIFFWMWFFHLFPSKPIMNRCKALPVLWWDIMRSECRHLKMPLETSVFLSDTSGESY